MPRCALIVEFELHPGKKPDFLAVMNEHARLTKAEEPGCRQFDVLQPVDHVDRIILVEVYDDRAAYEAHRAGTRMPGVNAAIQPMTTGRKVAICAID